MKIIYKSFFKKKINRIYQLIFMSLGIVLAFLFISKNYFINKANEVYSGSFLYFTLESNFDLNSINNIANYNRAIKVNCNEIPMDIFITNNEPIFSYNDNVDGQCTVDNYTIPYSYISPINLIENKDLYKIFDNKQDEYHYFVGLDNWFFKNKTIKELNKKYKIEVESHENKKDSNDYSNLIIIFNTFIIVVDILFLILLIVSIFNVIVDEKKNNNLYHYLGYSKLKIGIIMINKIMLLIFPILLYLFYFFVFKNISSVMIA